jgi:hypothetical protein
MPQPKGKSGNPAGRPAGTPNKTTKELREWVSNFIDANTERIEKDFETLEPAQRILFFEKMLKFVLPTKNDIVLEKGTNFVPPVFNIVEISERPPKG